MAVVEKIFAIVALAGVLLINCSSRQIPLEIESIRKNQLVTITTSNGQSFSGEVAGQNKTAFIVAHSNSDREFAVIDKANIQHITGPEPIIDARGELVTEQEIDATKDQVNFTTHIVLGGLFSLGASLFASSLVSNEFPEKEQNAFVITGTTLGTITGTVLFGQSGARKDRQMAIENIITERFRESLTVPSSETSNEQILEHIHTLRRKRLQQQKEIERLRDEIRSMEQHDAKQ